MSAYTVKEGEHLRIFYQGVLALSAHIHLEQDVYSLTDLFIAPDHQNEALIAAFLNHIEEKAKGYAGLLVIYPGGNPFETLFDSLTNARGWEPPENYKVRCRFQMDAFNPPWLSRFSLPKSYEILPFQHSPTRSLEASGIVDSTLLPSLYDPEPLNSLSLSYQGNVVGWLITQEIALGTLEYSAFWVHPDHRLASMALLAASINIQKEHQTLYPFAEAEANYLFVSRRWTAFFKRWLEPHSIEVKRLYRAFKQL